MAYTLGQIRQYLQGADDAWLPFGIIPIGHTRTQNDPVVGVDANGNILMGTADQQITNAQLQAALSGFDASITPGLIGDGNSFPGIKAVHSGLNLDGSGSIGLYPQV